MRWFVCYCFCSPCTSCLPLSFLCASDAEGSWTQLVEKRLGVSKSHPVDAAHESVQSLLARGVKRRIQADSQSDFNTEHLFASPQKQATQHASQNPCISQDSLQNVSQDKPTAAGCDHPGPHSNEWPNALHQKSRPQSWRTAFRPVQQPVNYSSPCPIWAATTPATTAQPSKCWQHVQETDADVAVDVDCCGDSGSISKLCSLHSAVPAVCLKGSLRKRVISTQGRLQSSSQQPYGSACTPGAGNHAESSQV